MKLRTTLMIAAMSVLFAAAAQAKSGETENVTGKIVGATDQGFRLDDGNGVVDVAVDNWDAKRKAYSMIDGDTATVHGTDTGNGIHADTVQLNDFKGYFFINTADYAKIDYPS